MLYQVSCNVQNCVSIVSNFEVSKLYHNYYFYLILYKHFVNIILEGNVLHNISKGRARMIVEIIAIPVKSVPFTTNVVRSNPAPG